MQVLDGLYNKEFRERINEKIDKFGELYKENHKGLNVDYLLKSVKNINSLSIQEVKKEEMNDIVSDRIVYSNIYDIVKNVIKKSQKERKNTLNLIKEYLPKNKDILKHFFGSGCYMRATFLFSDKYYKKIEDESCKVVEYVKSNRKILKINRGNYEKNINDLEYENELKILKNILLENDKENGKKIFYKKNLIK